MHADKTNRTMLILLSLVLIAAGAVGLVAGSGLTGFGHQTRGIDTQSGRRLHRSQRRLAVACGRLMLLALACCWRCVAARPAVLDRPSR